MRRCLCAVLLSCILGVASITAGELTTAQAQQVVSAAQTAQPGGKPVEATLAIDGKNVVFTVTRDAVGNVIARPIPGPDSAGIGIAQISIQMHADASGVLTPTVVVVISTTQTVASYSVQLNADGTIASLYQAGGLGGTARGPSQPKPVVGGIGSRDAAVAAAGGYSRLPEDLYPKFTSGQLSLPAGAGTGEVSQSHP
jgi:hypothetical protein